MNDSDKTCDRSGRPSHIRDRHHAIGNVTSADRSRFVRALSDDVIVSIRGGQRTGTIRTTSPGDGATSP